MVKLLDEYENILHEATYVTSEYKKWKTYECDQNSKEIKIEVDNKSVNKIPNFGYHLTTGVKTFYKLGSQLQVKLSSQF